MKVSRSRSGAVGRMLPRSRSTGARRSFPNTVASWYDGGAPGRFVPTYKDWQTSGALWLDSSTRITALEQAVWMNLDRSRNLARSAELVANGDFGSATGWAVTGAGAAITGGQGVFTAAATGAGFSQGIAIAGKTYEVVYTVVSVSAGAVRAYAGSGGIGTNRTAPGTYREIIVASGTNLMSLTAIGTTTAAVDNVSFKEIPGAHRIQPTSTARPILTARKNQLTNSAWLGGGALPTGWSNPGASGTAAPNGNTADGSVIYRFTAVGERPLINQLTAVPLSAAGSQAGSITVEQIHSGSAAVSQVTTWVNLPSGATQTFFKNGVTVASGTLVAVGDRVGALAIGGGTAGTPTFRVGLGTSSAVTGDISLSTPMVTVGGLDQVGRYQRTGLSPQTGDYDAEGFPVGLRYDGIDDGQYTTANIDLSGTPYLSIAGAWRVEGGTGTQTLIESSSGYSGNDGAIELTMNELNAGGLTFARRVGGSVQYRFQPAGQTTPRSASLTGRMNSTLPALVDIDFKVNGTLATSAGGTPASASTFGNYVWSYGRRIGGGLYYAGMEYGDLAIGMYRSDADMDYVNAQFALNLSEALA